LLRAELVPVAPPPCLPARSWAWFEEGGVQEATSAPPSPHPPGPESPPGGGGPDAALLLRALAGGPPGGKGFTGGRVQDEMGIVRDAVDRLEAHLARK